MRFTSIITALGLASSVLAIVPNVNKTAIVPFNNTTKGISSTNNIEIEVDDLEPVKKVTALVASVEVDVGASVGSVVELIKPATNQLAQLTIVSELVTDLVEIKGILLKAVGEVVGIVLPSVLGLVGDVVVVVGELLNVVLALVGDVVEVLYGVVETLLGPIRILVEVELKAILSLIQPLLAPILVYVNTVATDVPEIAGQVAELLSLVNGVLPSLGLPLLDM